MTNLGLDISDIADLLRAQPKPIRDAFYYWLCLMMVEAGKMELVETMPGEEGPICVFRSAAGESIVLPKPALDGQQQEAAVKQLRDALRDKGWL
jgi:hypothetical protein